MNWDMIAAISGALGAIGIILTVVYLAIQVKQNTASVEGATEQSLMSLEVDTWSFIAEHMNVYRRGSEDLENLDADELALFEMLVLSYLCVIYAGYVQYKRKLIPLSLWAGYRDSYAVELSKPGLMAMWKRVQTTYPQEFQDEIDGDENIG